MESPAAAAEAFHCRTGAETAALLRGDAARGLDAEEAARRLAENGPNELEEKPRASFLSLLLDQFKDFLVIILIAASIISVLLGEWVDAGAIILIVILNAVIGVIQESKAEEALAALKRMAAPEARVIRGGQTLTVPSRELVPGDVVLLESGNYVPADVRLLESANLRIEEASLTGESVPVEKRPEARLEESAPLGDRCTMAWMGTLVSFGRGRGMVTATAMGTQIGLIAAMLQEESREQTPLQRKLTQMGRWLGIAALAICAVIFLVGALEGRDILEMFLISVSLAIAAVPEGLPAIVTVCLALGMQEMIRRHALIRKLPAVETLGSATVICTDKTGTLTQNEMTAGHLWADDEILAITGGGYQPTGEVQRDHRRAELRELSSVRLLLQAALLASDAHLELADAPQEAETTAPGPAAEPARVPAAESVPVPAAESGHLPPAAPGQSEESRWRMVGDPTEGALVVAAAKAGLFRGKVEALFPRIAELPFDSDRKIMSTIHRVPTRAPDPRDAAALPAETPLVTFAKGAPDLLLGDCTTILKRGVVTDLSEAERAEVLQVNAILASRALRVLGVAYRPLQELPADPIPGTVERDMTFLGLVGMMDPARAEAAEAVALAHRAGLKVIMVTGDYRDTAAAIARKIGLIVPAAHDGARAEAGALAGGADSAEVLSGAEIDALDDAGLARAVEHARVFARVSPQHKVRIVEALKAGEQIVGMTGDGVNDAPALKRADIGIAMGITGTDVTKQTADMVLTDDNFASIVAAVEQGRVIFSNIRKFVYFLLSSNLGEIGTIFLGTLFGWPVPLTAVQLLWMNLVTDGAPAMALGMEKGEPGIMDHPPRPTREPIINRSLLAGLIIQTIVITAVTLTAFWVGYRRFGGTAAARTMAFVTLSGCQLLRVYSNRSERASVFAIGVFSNRWLQYAVAASALLLLAVVYLPGVREVFYCAPPSLAQWAWMAPLLLLPAIADEALKLVLRMVDARRRA